MKHIRSVVKQATAGYAIVLVCLCGGMFFAVQRLAQLSNDQVAALRGREYEITVAERLRWTGEEIVAAGRGYLLTADPELATRLHRSEASFNETLQSLKSQSLGALEASRVGAVEKAALTFLERQRVLVAARRRDEDSTELARRFERELRPLQRRLGVVLEGLVAERERSLDAFYEKADAARARTGYWLYGFLGLLSLLAGVTTWFFARTIDRSFRLVAEAHDEARRAVAVRDELMGVVAHDLRNPLATIALNASAMQKRSESEKVRLQAGSIERLAGRMGQLISTMLDAATLESGHLLVSPRPCDVAGLVNDAVEAFESLASSRALNLTLSMSVPEGVRCMADADRVLQVLSNLLGNALKFSPPEGTVGLSVDQQGDEIHFAVSDSGPGIAPELQPFVFDRFWKHEGSGYKGTGLGLFIVRGIVQEHGGRVWVESAPGQGATFHFTLPVAA